MPHIRLSIECPDFTEELARLKENLSPAAFYTVWGTLAERELRRAALAQGGNRFWREIEGSLKRKVTGDGVSIFCDYRGIHKKFGGPILPKKGKYLTIPVYEAKGKGKAAADYRFEGKAIFPFTSSKGNKMLGYIAENGQLHALFVLKERVDQKSVDWYSEEALAQIGILQVISIIEGAKAS